MKKPIDNLECIEHYEGYQYQAVLTGMAVMADDVDVSSFLFSMATACSELTLCQCIIQEDYIIFHDEPNFLARP